MSFLTEDPDTVNTIYMENLKEALASIRSKAKNNEFPTHAEPFGTVWKERPQPDVRTEKEDVWAQRYDHPKD